MTIYLILLFEVIVVGIDTMWTIKYGLTVSRRNNKVMLDVVVDVFSAVVPLLIISFVYRFPFTEREFIFLSVVPSLLSLSKLYEIVDASIRERGAIYLNRYREKSFKVRRLSFFNSWRNGSDEDVNENVAKKQMEHTPKIVHFAFFIFLVLYGLFLGTTAFVQLVTFKNVNCSDEISSAVWRGCTVKLYFCNDIFSPQCNCAIIDIEGHNMTILPDPIFTLDALKNVKVNHGPLQMIQPEIKKLKTLAALNLNNNHLSSVPEAISSLEFLLSLKLANNMLNDLPSKIWGMGLVYLVLDNNNISRISKHISSAQSLTTLLLSNNSVTTLPKELGDTNLRWITVRV
eukprot:g1939.t1